MYTGPDSKEPPLLSIYKLTMYEDDFDRHNIKSVLILEKDMDANLTPDNIKDKLATILTFS